VHPINPRVLEVRRQGVYKTTQLAIVITKI
jgi:hypothetical protein